MSRKKTRANIKEINIKDVLWIYNSEFCIKKSLMGDWIIKVKFTNDRKKKHFSLITLTFRLLFI